MVTKCYHKIQKKIASSYLAWKLYSLEEPSPNKIQKKIANIPDPRGQVQPVLSHETKFKRKQQVLPTTVYCLRASACFYKIQKKIARQLLHGAVELSEHCCEPQNSKENSKMMSGALATFQLESLQTKFKRKQQALHDAPSSRETHQRKQTKFKRKQQVVLQVQFLDRRLDLQQHTKFKRKQQVKSESTSYITLARVLQNSKENSKIKSVRLVGEKKG